MFLALKLNKYIKKKNTVLAWSGTIFCGYCPVAEEVFVLVISAANNEMLKSNEDTKFTYTKTFKRQIMFSFFP